MGATEDVLDFLGAVGGEVSDHLGRVTSIIAQAMPYPGSQASLSTLLHNLERRGLVTRDIRERRTYAIRLTAPRTAAGSSRLPPPDGNGPAPVPSPPPAPTAADAWDAERAIYSAAIARARQRISEFEEQLAAALAETNEAVRRADELQEQVGMAERTIGSMRTQLLDARKQIDLLRRKGTDRRHATTPSGAPRTASNADWDRLMGQRPDR